MTHTSTTSSAARMKALAKAAAARESAQYEKLITEKEHERKQREAEIERKCEEERAQYKRLIAEKEHECKQREAEIERECEEEHAQHEKELEILAANKKVAIADAKLKAIQDAVDEEEIDQELDLKEIPNAKSEERTFAWVHSPAHQEIPQRKPTLRIGTLHSKECPKFQVGIRARP